MKAKALTLIVLLTVGGVGAFWLPQLLNRKSVRGGEGSGAGVVQGPAKGFDSIGLPEEGKEQGPGLSEDARRSLVEGEGQLEVEGTATNLSTLYSIRVVRDLDGLPIAGATVRLGDSEVNTNENGLAEVLEQEARDPEGTRFRVAAEGYATRGQEIATSVTDWEVRLVEADRLVIRVLDEDTREPFKKISVRAYQYAPYRVRVQDLTDEEGRVDLGYFFANRELSLRIGLPDGRSERRDEPWAGESELEVLIPKGGRIHGQVLDELGQPAANIPLELREDGGRTYRRGKVITDERGHFVFRGLRLNQAYQVRALDRYNGSDDTVGRDGKSEVVRLTQETPERSADLRLSAYAQAQLKVSVTNEAGGRMPGLRVRAVLDVPLDTERPRLLQRGSRKEGRTDERGVCELVFEKEGRYRLKAWLDGGMASRDFYTVVVLGDSAELKMEVETGRELGGRIFGPSGDGVDRFSVSWMPQGADDSYRTQTDEEGNFSISGLGEGSGTLRVAARERRGFGLILWYEQELALARADLAIHLPKPAVIRGVWPNPTDDEIDWVAERGSVRWDDDLSVAPDGRFELLFGVVDLPFDLKLSVGREGLDLKTLSLSPGQVLDLGVILPAGGGVLEAWVEDDRGQPITNARVNLRPEEGRSWRAATDSQGRFEVSSVLPWPGRLYIDADGFTGIRREAEDMFEWNGAHFVLERRGRIQGRIHSPDETANSSGWLARPSLFVTRQSDQDTTFISVDWDGSFESSLEPDKYQVYARAFGESKWIEGPKIEVLAGELTELEFELY